MELSVVCGKCERYKKRGKRVLRRFCKFQKLATFFQQFQLANNMDEGLCKRALTEVTFKFGNINDPDVNRNYEYYHRQQSLIEL